MLLPKHLHGSETQALCLIFQRQVPNIIHQAEPNKYANRSFHWALYDRIITWISLYLGIAM